MEKIFKCHIMLVKIKIEEILSNKPKIIFKIAKNPGVGLVNGLYATI